MRYMFLIYSPDDESMTPGEMQELALAHQALIEDASREGVFCAADALNAASTATTVRVEGEEVLLTDGPFADTKEQLAGYYILDCEDLDEALEWAAKIPTTCHSGSEGHVEVRPIRDVREIT